MQLDKPFWKKLALLVAGGIVLAFLLNNLSLVGTALTWLWGLLFPFILGFILAFLVNLPMSAIERLLFRGRQFRGKRPLSFFITLLVVLLVLGLIVFLVVPALVTTVGTLVASMPGYIRQAEAAIQPYLDYIPELEKWLEDLNIDWQSIVAQLTSLIQNGASNFLTSAIDTATGIVGGFFSFFIGLIFSIYLLLDKEHLIAQLKGLLKAYMPARFYDKTEAFGRLACHSYSSFVAGQFTEASILTLIYAVILAVGGFDYPLLIAVVIGVASLIPMFGAYIGCFVGVLLLLVSQGFWRALAFVIIMVVVQQLDGNLIYPHIVGSTMGLPAIWTLVAVMVGGGFGGLFGMLMFIPLFNILYTLLRRDASGRLVKKGILSPVSELPPKPPHKQRQWPWQRRGKPPGGGDGTGGPGDAGKA